jgi:hypothetical protein
MRINLYLPIKRNFFSLWLTKIMRTLGKGERMRPVLAQNSIPKILT